MDCDLNPFIRFTFETFIKPLILLIYKIWYYRIDKTTKLPPVDNQLLLIPAHELAKKIRRKEVTSTEVVQTHINRIKQIQPLLNCVVKTFFEEALLQAEAIDKLLSLDRLPDEYSEDNAPLLGVPFSAKESFYVKGMPCASGFVARKDFSAPEDGEVVANMRKAGAILLCQTNTSELCMWIECSNCLYGVTKNPYNRSRTCGGSSGGSAALLSSGGSLIGIGNDIAGSIRLPCSLCGVYGHKASFELITNDGRFPASSTEGPRVKLLSTGPMCRYASDLKLSLKILAGPSRLKSVADKFNSQVNLKELKYYVLCGFEDIKGISKISKSSQNALNKAISILEINLNLKVEKVYLDGMSDSLKIYLAIFRNGNESVTILSDYISYITGKKYNRYYELVKWLFGKSDHSFCTIIGTFMERTKIPNANKYVEAAEKMKEQLNSILGENGVLLAPSFPVDVPYLEQTILLNRNDFLFFGFFNSLALPVTQCPIGLCPNSGLPLGIQIAANHNCDHLCISLAEYFEKMLVGWVPPF